MYNLATQVQVPSDADLDSYYIKQNHCMDIPYRIPFKKTDLGILSRISRKGIKKATPKVVTFSKYEGTKL
jgi:hypothetical protein